MPIPAGAKPSANGGTLREYPDRYKTFLFASDEEAAQLEEWYTRLLSKYGEEEALGIWRDIVYEEQENHGRSGDKILRMFNNGFAHLAPAAELEPSADVNAVDVLADLPPLRGVARNEDIDRSSKQEIARRRAAHFQEMADAQPKKTIDDSDVPW